MLPTQLTLIYYNSVSRNIVGFGCKSDSLDVQSTFCSSHDQCHGVRILKQLCCHDWVDFIAPTASVVFI